MRVVAMRPSPGSKRSITSPSATRSKRHSSAGRSARPLTRPRSGRELDRLARAPFDLVEAALAQERRLADPAAAAGEHRGSARYDVRFSALIPPVGTNRTSAVHRGDRLDERRARRPRRRGRPSATRQPSARAALDLGRCRDPGDERHAGARAPPRPPPVRSGRDRELRARLERTAELLGREDRAGADERPSIAAARRIASAAASVRNVISTTGSPPASERRGTPSPPRPRRRR